MNHESLFVSDNEDDERRWGERNYEEEEDELGWGGGVEQVSRDEMREWMWLTDGCVKDSFATTLHRNSTSRGSVVSSRAFDEGSAEDERRVPPTQRISQVGVVDAFGGIEADDV